MKTQTALECLGVPNPAEHYLVKTEKNSKKLCEFCKQNRNKSKGGWWVYTRYMCKDCKIPLCNRKPCLFFFHRDTVLKISRTFPNVTKEKFLELWMEAIMKIQNGGKGRIASNWMDTYPSIVHSSSHVSMSEQFSQSNFDSNFRLQVPLNLYSHQNMTHPCNEDWESGSDSYSDFKMDKDQ